MPKIRKILKGDEGQVKDLIVGIMQAEFPGSAIAFSTEDIQEPFEYYGGTKNAFFVAEKDGKIVGTVGIKKDDEHSALLRRLFIDKTFRGKGFGNSLVAEALSFCKKHGYKKVMFRGTDTMKAAINVCLKNGFKEKDILVLPHVKMVLLEKSL